MAVEDSVGEMMVKVENAHSFPGPWVVEVTEGGHFVVKDATGFSVCFVHARKDEALHSRSLANKPVGLHQAEISRGTRMDNLSSANSRAFQPFGVSR
jgi:hypothetical protein